jgi:pimeloyl-ACP methyl ester carboxylesterase
LSTIETASPLDPPQWFTRAISQPAESRFVQVDGVPIHYLCWNPQDEQKPGLLFAHGFRAHARWWSFVAPFFTSRFRVCALDFAGMGDSGHRPHYEAQLFTQDLVSVIESARLGPATLIGHSFGGARLIPTCAEFPQLVQRAVLIDSMVNVPGQPRRDPPHLELRPKKVYPTLEAALERFRLVPEPNTAASYIIDYIGRHSLQRDGHGWSWKFDPNFAPRQNEPDGSSYLQRIEVPLTFIYGEHSIVVQRERAHAIVGHMRNGRGPIAIPTAHHHVLLDQPLALVSALRAVLY